MKQTKNQKGFALLTVLFVIIIFSIIGTVVINLTVGNSKQVDITEQDMKTVDLAEMGVIFYKNKVIHYSDTVISDSITKAVEKIKSENEKIIKETHKNKTPALIPINETEVISRLWLFMSHSDILPNDFTPGDPIKIDATENSFNIKHQSQKIDSNTISISFTSNGKSRSDEASINGTITIDLGDLVTTYLSGPVLGSGIRNEVLTKLTLPLSNSSIIENGFSYNKSFTKYDNLLEGVTAVINGEFAFKNGNRSKNNAYLYVTGDVNFGNSNKEVINKMKIFTEKNLFFHNTKGGFSNSIFYVNGDINFHNLVGPIKNTKFCVIGDINDSKNNFPNEQLDSSSKWNEGKYKCMYFGGPSEGTPGTGDITDRVVEQIENMNLIYN